jgi:prepilin-type N-terminal cleavage/methylation domain-containing protein
LVFARTDSRGFTLIELMAVIALVAAMMLYVVPKMSSSLKVSINSTAREMAAASREAYNSAVLTGRVHRMVYDMKAQQYWAESGPTTVLLDTQETKEKEERRKRFSHPDDKPPPSEFALARTITRKKIDLPRGVEFEDVFSEQKPDAITEGTAFTHFLAERTIIHIKDNSDHHVTLILSPLVGRTKVIPRYVKKDEPDAQ